MFILSEYSKRLADSRACNYRYMWDMLSAAGYTAYRPEHVAAGTLVQPPLSLQQCMQLHDVSALRV
jgi:hypothetical protein